MDGAAGESLLIMGRRVVGTWGSALRFFLALALAFPQGVLLPTPVLAAGRVESLSVSGARVVLSGDRLGVEVMLGGLFSPRVSETLERGLPASLVVTADLWRDRAGWFDRLESTHSVLYRIRYDAWREDFDLQRGIEPVAHLDSLTTVAGQLSQPIHILLADLEALHPGERYYAVISSSLRLLSSEGLREIEEFLAQRGAGGRRSGPPAAVVRLPRSILSVLAALTGLSAEMATYRTPYFQLPRARRAAARPPGPTCRG